MRHEYLLVFDIETIPDCEATRNLCGIEDETIDNLDIRNSLTSYHLGVTAGKNAFPRQLFHKIVCISFLLAKIHRDSEGSESYEITDIRSGGKIEDDERTLVAGFFRYLEKYTPRLVTFNGRTFDMPALKYRAMKYNISAKSFYNMGDKWNSYNSRYSIDWHCDLLDVLSDFGASARIKMNEVCALLNLPGKLSVSGNNVTTMYDQGKIEEIRHYCETDVANTYLIYLKYALHRGLINHLAYLQAMQSVEEYIQDMPHFEEFLMEMQNIIQ